MTDSASDFIAIVQTAVLANVQHLLRDEELAVKYRHEISALGVAFTMAQATRAAKRIPANLDAADAAGEFIAFIFGNIRERTEQDTSREVVCPGWMTGV